MSDRGKTGRQTPPVLTPKWRRELRRRFKAVPFVGLIGMRLVDLETGAAAIALRVRDDLRQYQGLVHGGVIAALADTAATFAALTVLPDSNDIVTIEFKLNYLEPLRGGRALARARTIRVGKNICVAEVTVTNGAARPPVAAGIFTMAILTGKRTRS